MTADDFRQQCHVLGAILSPNRIGRMLKTLRESKGLTQVELASKAKLTQPYLAELEAGKKKNPSLALLQRLAKALGVPVTELLR
jgi:transcriptional regulator with XRE-family HTH domain